MQMPLQSVTPNDIHGYWFGDTADWALVVKRNNVRWFEQGRALDDEIRLRFAATVELAKAGDLDEWMDSPQSAIALILLLDQFPRHIHRGQGEAFAGDEHALAMCKLGMASGMDARLSTVEQSFFYLPLQHAENIEAQELSVAVMARRAEESPRELHEYMRESLQFAERHRDIVARFGRFPHRNAALGRVTTAEEEAYLQRGGDRFGQ